MKFKKNKRSQEEMVGFAVIIVLVSIILLILLGVYLNNDEERKTIESYELTSFVHSMLQYTTEYRTNLEYRSIRDLISDCGQNKKDINGLESCEVLEENLNEILESTWEVSNETPVKGYSLIIEEGENNPVEVISISRGNQTQTSRSNSQDIGTGDFNVFFRVFY